MVLGALVASGAAAETVQVGADLWPPYQEGSEDGSVATGGIFVDAAKAAFAKLGIDAEVRLYPWRRVMDMAKDGRIDFVLGLTKTAEREEFLAFPPTPMAMIGLSIFYDPTHTAEPESEAALAGSTVSVAAGYSYGPRWAEMVKKYDVKIDQSPNDKTGLRKVVMGRIPYHLCYSDVCRAEILDATFPSADIIMEATWEVDALPFFIAASKKSVRALEILAELDKALQ